MKTQRWIDLSAQNIYLGSIKMADGVERLSLIDMNYSVAPEKLAEIGFLPFEGSPRYDKGIYYMAGEQKLRPSRIAAAIGIERCPLVDVAVSEIETVFRERCMEKFQANLNAVTLRCEVLGQNAQGDNVYRSPAGRFVRTSTSEAVVESSLGGQALNKALFLRSETDEQLRACSDGFVGKIMGGQKASWAELQKFARVVFDKSEPSDGELHRLQEAVEAAAYRAFSQRANGPNESAFKLATDVYYGLPGARMRTAESVSLQQYSTPLPMSVVAQRLMIGTDDLSGCSVLEPTAGNGGLLNLTPAGAKVYALELDRKRLEALRENPRIHAELGDATDVPFRARFGEPDGFDYTIANPPFGGMDESRSFDKLPAVRRIDHYIALRTLSARKDHGRSVLICGADNPQSDGTVKGGAKAFLNYIHDHYEVHGCVEVDGRMYSRQGAGYNVRLMVIGDKLARPREVKVPEKLPILTTYEELWGWSEKVIAAYNAPRPTPGLETTMQAEAVKLGDWIRFTAHDAGDPLSVGVVEGLVVDLATTSGGDTRYRVLTNIPAPLREGNIEKLVYSHQGSIDVITPQPSLVQIDAASVVVAAAPAFTTDANLPAVVVATPVVEREPWMMTNDEWSAARSAGKAEVGQGPGRVPGGGQSAAIGEADRLSFGVALWYQERALAGDSQAIGWMEFPTVTHRDVIAKAVFEKLPVPNNVIAEYPELIAVMPERRINEFQTPYQPASKLGAASAMVPINMAGSTYAALNDLEAREGAVDDYVAKKLRYSKQDLGERFSPEQIDALALAIRSVESGRGIINADQTGMGKGRFVAGMMRYAKVNEKTPIFVTIKPELFTDIFRDIEDIGSRDLFKKLFIFNEGVHVMRFGTEDEVLYRATSPQDRRKAIDDTEVEPDVDMVLATYSQFQRAANKNLKVRLLNSISQGETMLFLDEAHVASGASNISAAVGEAVANCKGVVYFKLSGSKVFMSTDISREQLPELMRRLQVNNHVGKFYLAEPNQDVLKAVKGNYSQEFMARTTPSHGSEPV